MISKAEMSPKVTFSMNQKPIRGKSQKLLFFVLTWIRVESLSLNPTTIPNCQMSYSIEVLKKILSQYTNK